MEDNALFRLLDLDPYNEKDRQRLDGEAIIQETQASPHHVEIKYHFNSTTFCCEPIYPLQQAIMLRAPISVIRGLCCPMAIKDRDYEGYNILHLAVENMASIDVIAHLLEKRPEAVRESEWTNSTPLLMACHRSPLEVISLLVDCWPDALGERNEYGHLPLHYACMDQESLDVVSLLVDRWPDGIKCKDKEGFTPLHLAFKFQAPLEVISFLVERWPDLSTIRCNDMNTPLHLVCSCGGPLNFFILLLEKFPEATMEKNNEGETPLDVAKRVGAPVDTQRLIHFVSSLCDNGTDGPPPKDIMSFFIQIGWWKGVALVLDSCPSFTRTMNFEIRVIPDHLCMLGRCCKLATLWDVLRNKQDLFKDI